MRKLSAYALAVLARLRDGYMLQDVSGAVFAPGTANAVMHVRTPTIRALENKGLLQNRSRNRLKVFILSKQGEQYMQRVLSWTREKNA